MRFQYVLACLVVFECGPTFSQPKAQPSDLMRPGVGDWCYAPVEPLTQTQKQEFLAFVIDQSQIVEKKYGIPAAPLAAMALHESGYGRTRLAILSNNILSFKYPANKEWQFGRPIFTLWCQPMAGDKGNRYPLFGSMSAAFDYVGLTLSQRSDLSYQSYFLAYRAALGEGKDKKQASIAWLKRVAGTYSSTPTYADDVLRFADNPLDANSPPEPGKTLWDLLP